MNRLLQRWGYSGLLLIAGYAISQPAIHRVEYFYDTDPGFGNGISIPVTQGINISNQTAAVNIGNLTDGLHNLYIRSRANNGKWSLTATSAFVKLSLPANNLISKAEYFFDADPGMGLGTNIPVSSSSNIADQAVAVNIGNLADGLHKLYLRTLSAGGRWSLTASMVFVKLSTDNTTIAAAEYFIDTDPGTGKGVPVAMVAANPIPGFAIPVNLTGLTEGPHKLYLRSLNQLGQWSLTNVFEFTYNSPAAAPRIQINAITRKSMCASQSFDISFDATGNYNNGNQFRVELSNSAGSFASPEIIGLVTSQSDNIVKCTLPRVATGNNYKIRVVSTNPVVTGVVADTAFTLWSRPDLGPDVVSHIVCQGERVNINPLFTTTGLTAQWSTANPANAPAGTHTLIVTNSNGCTDTARAIVRQDVKEWLGVNANGWHSPANWSGNTVPTEKSHVIITAGKPNACVLNGNDANVASIQLRNGANITVGAGRKINITAGCNPLPQ